MIKTNAYLDQYRKINQNKKILEIEQYGYDNNVPIITKDSLETVLTLINIINAKKILEIGTAIGYSSSCFVINSNRMIDTIERNEEMYHKALANIKELGLENQVNIIFNDALEVDNNTLKQDYDILFIDAAKAQSVKFFNKYAPLVKDTGIIITDNILFHGCVENQEGLSKNVKNMVKKIDEYNKFLANHEEYDTYFLECGDGLAVSKKKCH